MRKGAARRHSSPMRFPSGMSGTPDPARPLRWLAGGLLVAMGLVFAIGRRQVAAHPLWQWPLAFAEAALVGGLADWFAVTALFRRPLGLPIPHTAIIPTNRDRLADSLARFVERHFLVPAALARRLRGVDFAALAAGEGAGAGWRAPLRQALGEALAALPEAEVAGLLRDLAAGLAARMDLPALVGARLAAAVGAGRHEDGVAAALRWLGGRLEAHEDLLRAVVHARSINLLRWTGLDEALADRLLDGACRVLAEAVVDPAHPLRRRITGELAELARRLQEDAALRARLAALQAQWLGGASGAALMAALWRGLRGGLAGGLPPLPQLLAEPAARWRFNRHVRRLLVGLASRHGGAIASLVSTTIRSWDSTTLTARMEGAIGRDLQYIRLNGTLVGGLLGLALHALGLLG